MSDSLRVFGYGSLTWKKPSYSSEEIGCIKGYKRRFWQGSVTHRGQENQWGRVATIIPSENPEDEVWGVMSVVTDKDAIPRVRAELDDREINTGGYDFEYADFYPRDSSGMVHTVLVYLAREDNRLFWREDDFDKMAEDIVNACGFAGPNIEYVTKMADFMKKYIPEETDPHLFTLDKKVREKCQAAEQ